MGHETFPALPHRTCTEEPILKQSAWPPGRDLDIAALARLPLVIIEFDPALVAVAMGTVRRLRFGYLETRMGGRFRTVKRLR